MEPERLVVGRIAKAHGIRGDVAVDVVSDAPDRFEPGSTMNAGARTLTVESAREHQGRLLVKFAEVPDRTHAETLRGVELTIDASEARALDEGEFFERQLEGLAVVDTQGRALGTFARAEEGPAHDLWVVQTPAGEVYVPAVKEVVRAVDLDARRLVLDPPEGMFE
jgi:16S rRNA processing protein RimM